MSLDDDALFAFESYVLRMRENERESIDTPPLRLLGDLPRELGLECVTRSSDAPVAATVAEYVCVYMDGCDGGS